MSRYCPIPCGSSHFSLGKDGTPDGRPCSWCKAIFANVTNQITMSKSCIKFTVYVLKLTDGSYYVGSTSKTVAERVQEHQIKRPGSRLIDSVKWCTTREAAERIERKVAAALKRSGKTVKQS